MSDAEEELVVAEMAPAASRKPSLLTALSIGGILIALMKLSSLAASLPWLFKSAPASGAAGPGVPEQMVEYQRLIAEMQAQYAPYQMVIVPISLIASGFLFWASLKALKLAPRGDVWIRRSVLTAAATDVLGTVMAVLIQIGTYHVLQTVMEGFDGDPENVTATYLRIAMQVGFYIGVGAGIGFVVLQFGYYYFAFRYFSKPETRALYETNVKSPL
ncbi:hypothetical protein LOC68_23970 [Blastopirellula sp. JC732]|uniref:Uncharacterized protein n=1 Tax=Blastopirellula sediminis TaxID=2894196 RepID=A0A9X1MRT6_9BACT|nr:hypothetical protein [Blastopirellula sediminis]MCC9605236.1 hypothetical protein [Blastopirellula sediminis]MCC9631464.1 hypothetical protein [Blastopirellula sediminis]